MNSEFIVVRTVCMPGPHLVGQGSMYSLSLPPWDYVRLKFVRLDGVDSIQVSSGPGHLLDRMPSKELIGSTIDVKWPLRVVSGGPYLEMWVAKEIPNDSLIEIRCWCKEEFDGRSFR